MYYPLFVLFEIECSWDPTSQATRPVLNFYSHLEK